MRTSMAGSLALSAASQAATLDGAQRLADADLATVTAQADSGTPGSGASSSTDLLGGWPGNLGDALRRGVQADPVSRSDFLQAWLARSGSAWPAELPVAERLTQMSFVGDPINVDTSLSDWLGAGTRFQSSVSMGTLSLRALDLRGTTLWLWTR